VPPCVRRSSIGSRTASCTGAPLSPTMCCSRSVPRCSCSSRGFRSSRTGGRPRPGARGDLPFRRRARGRYGSDGAGGRAGPLRLLADLALDDRRGPLRRDRRVRERARITQCDMGRGEGGGGGGGGGKGPGDPPRLPEGLPSHSRIRHDRNDRSDSAGFIRAHLHRERARAITGSPPAPRVRLDAGHRRGPLDRRDRAPLRHDLPHRAGAPHRPRLPRHPTTGPGRRWSPSCSGSSCRRRSSTSGPSSPRFGPGATVVTRRVGDACRTLATAWRIRRPAGPPHRKTQFPTSTEVT
jgi:hypothetical protein